VRLFVAVNIPKEEKDRIYRVSRVLRDQGFPVRWANPDLFHLTLKFLGEVRTDKQPGVEKVMEAVGASTGSFTMDIGGFGAFPTLRRPRVLWVGVDPSPALRCLKQDIEWGLSEQGFQRETRAFHPHFTLGRTTTDGGVGAFRGLDDLAANLSYDGTVEVKKVDLMESHLSSSGPRYVVLSSFPLNGPQGR
jgi:2'-5' RNA ligase